MNVEFPRYQTCSAFTPGRYICAPPSATVYGSHLIVTGAS